MRRVFLRLEVLAVIVVAVCLAILSGSEQPSRAEFQLTSGPGGSLTLSNDKEGAAILSLDVMRPGDFVTDTVTLGNTGSLDGDFSLATSNLVDTPGGGGGALSGELDLRIRDVTNAGSPVTVYNGKLDALAPTALGNLAAGDSRVYEFRVSFPDAGVGAENAFQGSAMSIEFDWSAVNDSLDLDPPETTITSGPPALSASPDASFAFTSDEAGSSFECSVDGTALSSCTSPTSLTGLSDGAHTFDVRATDGAGNTDGTPDSASWTIDATAPNVALADPGSPVRGTVTLNPSADDGSGSGVATLIVQRSPAGAESWTTIGTSWDTTTLADGSYDLRARATDNAGNVAPSPVRTVTVDNRRPALVSSTPADGELVAAAASLQIVADEDLAGIASAEIDGAAAPVPALAGATATYTNVFSDGPHTFSGELEDAAGNARSILVHFTVDVQMPTKPGQFTGAKQNGDLVLKWTGAKDNSGVIGAYLVYANGLLVKTLGGSARSADLGRFRSRDGRAFQVAARDAADNVGPKTRALVIVPRVAGLSLASAQAKLTARGLRTGTVSYVYSTTVAAGLIVSARSDVVFKGSSVGLTVSRGPAARDVSTTPPPTTGGTTGYNGYGFPPSGTTFGGTTPEGTNDGGTPTIPTTPAISGGPGGEDSLSPPAGANGSDNAGEVEPQSYTPADDGTSALRRVLGLALLGGAFAAAGAVALRARRPRRPRADELSSAVEPLLFWDQRLLQVVTSSLRRVTGRF